MSFATQTGKQKITASNGKVFSAYLIRDLFGSILYISLQSKGDMAEVLKYPLTPVPLFFSHVDETMLSTPKSALLTYLETKGTRKTIKLMLKSLMQHFFFFFFFHFHEDLPANSGGVANYLLKKILQRDGNVIHFVSDKWMTPSIKRNRYRLSYC